MYNSFFNLRAYLPAYTNVHSELSMYGLQRRLNSDKGHVDLQKRTADVRNTRQSFTAIIPDNKAALYSNTLVRFKVVIITDLGQR